MSDKTPFGKCPYTSMQKWYRDLGTYGCAGTGCKCWLDEVPHCYMIKVGIAPKDCTSNYSGTTLIY